MFGQCWWAIQVRQQYSANKYASLFLFSFNQYHKKSLIRHHRSVLDIFDSKSPIMHNYEPHTPTALWSSGLELWLSAARPGGMTPGSVVPRVRPTTADREARVVLWGLENPKKSWVRDVIWIYTASETKRPAYIKTLRSGRTFLSSRLHLSARSPNLFDPLQITDYGLIY